LLKATKFVGEHAGIDNDLGVSGIGDMDALCRCIFVGDVDDVNNREEGASIRKLQLSPFLSQFAHDGCLQSHWRKGQLSM
jgi:hypothetical protein